MVFSAAHPEVPIQTVAIDRELNDHGDIPPGLAAAARSLRATR